MKTAFGIVCIVVSLGLLCVAMYVGSYRQPLPICEKYTAYAAQDGKGNPVAVLDMANIRKLSALIQGLATGTCRLAPPQKTTAL